MEIKRATLTRGHARLKSKDKEWGLNIQTQTLQLLSTATSIVLPKLKSYAFFDFLPFIAHIGSALSPINDRRRTISIVSSREQLKSEAYE
jgi:hypothetical protein